MWNFSHEPEKGVFLGVSKIYSIARGRVATEEQLGLYVKKEKTSTLCVDPFLLSSLLTQNTTKKDSLPARVSPLLHQIFFFR